jgi:hypothetical protein
LNVVVVAAVAVEAIDVDATAVARRTEGLTNAEVSVVDEDDRSTAVLGTGDVLASMPADDVMLGAVSDSSTLGSSSDFRNSFISILFLCAQPTQISRLAQSMGISG